jgi:hypothetical protein
VVKIRVPWTVGKDIKLLRSLSTQQQQQNYVYDQFLELSQKFNNRCYVCEKNMSWNSKKLSWTLHHKKYYPNELTYRHFDKKKDDFLWKAKDWTPSNPVVKPIVKGLHMRSLYRLEVFRQVNRRPRQFLLMCGSHHQATEKILQYAPSTLKRLLAARKMTKTKWH